MAACGSELRLLLTGHWRWQQEWSGYCVGVVAVAQPAADRSLLAHTRPVVIAHAGRECLAELLLLCGREGHRVAAEVQGFEAALQLRHGQTLTRHHPRVRRDRELRRALARGGVRE